MSVFSASYLDWLDRCERPSCWTALSALQGSSTVRCTRLRWLPTRWSACSEMPVLAASEMIATSFLPDMNWFLWKGIFYFNNLLQKQDMNWFLCKGIFYLLQEQPQNHMNIGLSVTVCTIVEYD